MLIYENVRGKGGERKRRGKGGRYFRKLLPLITQHDALGKIIDKFCNLPVTTEPHHRILRPQS
jgi:hypothetical protein